MNQDKIKQLLVEVFSDEIKFQEEPTDMLVINSEASFLPTLVSYLKNQLSFSFLVDICGIHYPEQTNELGVVYQLMNMETNVRIRIKVFVSKDKPELPSLCEFYSGANWMERETFDFYGIKFLGHPNLIRILNVEYLDYFPMRKEYALEDPTREDKDNSFFGR